MAPILSVKDLAISFGSNHVLKSVNFELNENEVLGVVGPNGAGKTVMLDILTGVLKPTGGSITFCGEEISKKSIYERVRMGIGRTYQIPKSFEGMTAYENIITGGVYGAGMSEKEAKVQAKEILEIIGMSDRALTFAGKLGLLDRKRLEIGMAMASKPKIILFDEVAGGLTESEIAGVLDIVATIRKLGYSIIWIEHVIQTMLKGTDRVLCMANGVDVICGDPHMVMTSREVEEVYLGVKKK
ncbi:MAG: ATP-binding cassette domain-containing protein [Firmicutes bacterium]|nr:ATP-binding cassette domain-containing protein [Clostridiales bacterium]MBQ9931682.1 ATP-binding cassette domain-containing protein [Bacillota bacterium]